MAPKRSCKIFLGPRKWGGAIF